MDSGAHSESPSSASRKRPRENETDAQRIKREKAAERQRRKREKDRNAAGMMMGYPQSGDVQDHHQHQQQQPPPPQVVQPPPVSQSPQPEFASAQDLTPEEEARRDRVRAAARDRQRKHRALVKAKKMRDLGVDMGNEVIAGDPMAEMYRMGPEGYQMVPPHELAHLAQHAQMSHDQPFPQQPLTPPQAFASTLLLSFSCAPLLKGHLLRTLNMTTEELATLEPYIAEAWERWDNERRRRYQEHGVKPGGPSGPPPHTAMPPGAYAMPMHDAQGNPIYVQQPPPNGPSPSDPNQVTNEFRARFGRAVEAPPPFSTYAADPQASGSTTTPSSTAGSGTAPSSDSIDPHLVGSGGNGGNANGGQQKTER